MRTLAENRIAFAYPTQTTFTAAPDGTLVMPYAPLPGRPPSDAAAGSGSGSGSAKT